MLQPKTVLLTGATGFLGSHFLYRLLQEKKHVFVLVRGNDKEAARERVLGILRVAADSCYETCNLEKLKDYVHVVLGDITAPMCGVSKESISELSGAEINQVWHVAASLNYEERFRDQIRLQNVQGTANSLKLTYAVGAKHFAYVSTAYTAGKREGAIPESLHQLPVDFNNSYEESKVEAEHHVAGFCKAEGIDYCIVRPSVIVGPSTTKRSGGTTSGFYGFIRELRRMRDILNKAERPVTLVGDRAAPINLVPVDMVVMRMLGIHSSATNFGGAVHHLTNPNPPQVGPTIDTICELIGVQKFNITSTEEPSTPLEKLLERRMEFYGSYLRFPKIFSQAIPLPESLRQADVVDFARYAIAEKEKGTIESTLNQSTITMKDGVDLAVFDSGDVEKQPLVFVNAFGMSRDFAHPMSKALSSTFRFITWESRGCPNTAGEFLPQHASLDEHVNDIESILTALRVESPVHVVGWCSGAHVAHRFARRNPSKASSLAMLNGSFFFDSESTTDFQMTVGEVMPQIAKDPRFAEIYFATLYAGDDASTSESGQINNLLGGIDASLIPLTSLPFRSASSLYRYALMLDSMLSDGEETYAGSVRCPILIISGDNDTVAHYKGSVRFADKCANAKLSLIEGGDHYGLYFDSTVPEKIQRFAINAQQDLGASATDHGALNERGDVSSANVVAAPSSEANRPKPPFLNDQIDDAIIALSRAKNTVNGLCDQMDFRNDLGFDSIRLAQLYFRVLALFDLDICDIKSHFKNVRTIGDLKECVSNLSGPNSKRQADSEDLVAVID